MNSSAYCRCLSNILSSIKSLSVSAKLHNHSKASESQAVDKQAEKTGKQNSDGRQMDNAASCKKTRPSQNLSQTTKDAKELAQNSKHKCLKEQDGGPQSKILQLRQNDGEGTHTSDEHVEATDRPLVQRQANSLRGTTLQETEVQVIGENNDLIQSLSEEEIPQQESQLPTEKSQIIMNDIGKGIDLNENDFLFDQRQCYTNEEQFEQLYRKLQLIHCGNKYDQWLVQKISTNTTHKAYILKNLMKHIKGHEQQQKQEELDWLFQLQKDHLKSLISLSQLQPHPCPHLVSVIDYCIQPPHFTLSQNTKKFNEGQLIVVLELIDNDLSKYLSEQDIDSSQKQRVIRQMLHCISAVHQNGMVLRDFSLLSWKVDKFANLKLQSLSIESSSPNRSIQSNANHHSNLTPLQTSECFLCKAPQEPLPMSGETRESTLQKSYFHAGFSQISDFDIPELFIYTAKQDLWRLGVLIFKILTGEYPFETRESAQEQRLQIIKTLGQKNHQHSNHKTGEFNPKNADDCNYPSQNSKYMAKLSKLSRQEVQLVQRLLRLNPNERTECKQLLSLEYFNEVLWDSLYRIQNHEQ